MEEHLIQKKALKQTIYSKRRVGNPRKGWEGVVRGMLSRYWAHGLEKLNPKIENPGGNTLTRPTLDMGCKAIAAAAVAAYRWVDRQTDRQTDDR
jgi:hypothetical protein